MKCSMARLYAPMIVQLPEPPDTFYYRNVDIDRGLFSKLVRNGFLHKVDRGRYNDACYEWMVDSDLYEQAARSIERNDRFPCCGSRGFRNDAGQLRCLYCDAPLDRSLVREVVG